MHQTISMKAIQKGNSSLPRCPQKVDMTANLNTNQHPQKMLVKATNKETTEKKYHMV